jgi:hypothetical protein
MNSDRRLRAVGVVVALAGFVASAAVFVAVASAGSITDPAGDVAVEPQGANLTGLDITSVDVMNTPDDSGLVTFRVTLAGAPELPPDAIVVVLLDTDKNESTGDEGVDAHILFQVDSKGAQTLLVGRYDPSARAFRYVGFDPPPYADGTVVLTVGRFLLNNTRGFRFAALTVVGPSGSPAAVAADIAPDTGVAATYDLVGLPPLLELQRAIGEPTRPRAGDRFTVTSTVVLEESGELVRRGKVTCVAHVGKRRLRAVGRFTGAGARCAMTVPRGARGKTLRGTIRIQAAGATGVRSFVYRVI